MTQSTPPTVYDVIIVGAGVAGLSAAFTLFNQGKHVLLLESRADVGGRVKTNTAFTAMDLGAAYFGPLQTYTMRFTQALGIDRLANELPRDKDHRIEWRAPPIMTFRNESFPSFDERQKPLDLPKLGLLLGFIEPEKINTPIRADGPTPGQVLREAMFTLETLVLQMKIFLERPWDFPLAQPLDGQSVEDWITVNVLEDHVADLLRVGVRSALSADPEDVSMLYLVFYCATGGSFENVMAVGGGADTYRFAGGAEQLPVRLRDWVLGNGARTELKRVNVEAVENQPDDTVIVRGTEHLGSTPSAVSFAGKAAIIALSPPLRNTISVLDRNQVRVRFPDDAMGMGRTIKAFAWFREPWWEPNSSGYALSSRRDNASPVVWTMNNSVAGSTSEDRHCLMAFIVGAQADYWSSKSQAEREDAVLNHWSTIFETSPATIHELRVGYTDFAWSNESWSRGCPAAYFKKSKFGANAAALRQHVGKVYWAGAETATDWVGGYLNGAIQSGIRAALEIP